jgi:hypothetical protein
VAHPAFSGSFRGVKRPERGVYYPPPPTAEDNKEQTYTSTPFLCFQALFKGKLSPFPFRPEIHKDTDNCEYRPNPAVSCTLCEQMRTRTLGCGRVEGVESPQAYRLPFVQNASPRDTQHSANISQLSLFCDFDLDTQETSGGISRTGAVLVIILKLFTPTYSCKLRKTDVTLASASQTVSCYNEQSSAVVCCVCQLILLLSVLYCLATAVH